MSQILNRIVVTAHQRLPLWPDVNRNSSVPIGTS